LKLISPTFLLTLSSLTPPPPPDCSPIKVR
jgi:hypothetical protein